MGCCCHVVSTASEGWSLSAALLRRSESRTARSLRGRSQTSGGAELRLNTLITGNLTGFTFVTVCPDWHAGLHVDWADCPPCSMTRAADTEPATMEDDEDEDEEADAFERDENGDGDEDDEEDEEDDMTDERDSDERSANVAMTTTTTTTTESVEEVVRGKKRIHTLCLPVSIHCLSFQIWCCIACMFFISSCSAYILYLIFNLRLCAHVPAVCWARAVSGPCHAMLERWYFVPEKRRCAPFLFGGCGGNRNNFDSEEYCMAVCSSSCKSQDRSRRNPEASTHHEAWLPSSGCCRLSLFLCVSPSWVSHGS